MGHRVFNTHLRWEMMPRSGASKAKYIYVMRDGRDVVTSFYHHLSNQADSGGFEGSFDEFFDGFIDGSIPYGRWVDHVKSWLLRSGTGSSNVLVVYYEDLKADFKTQLRRISDFLELPYSQSKLDELAELMSFDFMKAQKDRFQPVSVGWKKGYEFIRKGAVGDHKNLLTEAHTRRFQACVEEAFPLDVLGFKGTYLQ